MNIDALHMGVKPEFCFGSGLFLCVLMMIFYFYHTAFEHTLNAYLLNAQIISQFAVKSRNVPQPLRCIINKQIPQSCLKSGDEVTCSA